MPPEHMPVVEGLVRPRRLPSVQMDASFAPDSNLCLVCCDRISSVPEQIKCFHCFNRFHCVCLASEFLRDGQTSGMEPDADCLVPVEGTCPACSSRVSWGDLIRFKKGCYRDGVQPVEVASQR
jgi:structure-specific endonuclease subunit SLX1